MSKQKEIWENARTETIVQSLENGEIALEDTIAALSKEWSCQRAQATLDKAEKPWLRSCRRRNSDFEWGSKQISSCGVGFGRRLYGDQRFASGLRESVLYSFTGGEAYSEPLLC